MDSLGHAAVLALQLIAERDGDVMNAVATSLTVSLTASVIACVIGAPLGVLVAIRSFRGRRALLIVVNAMLGLPPVVIGLVAYLLLSRAGPLGSLGLLFTVKAMIIAQVMLTLPIAIALTHRAAEAAWRDYGDALRIDGASLVRCVSFVLALESAALLTTFLAAFGRAISEVGAITIVGGNIREHTRTVTTAIVLETSKGEIATAMALAMILLTLALLVSAAAFLLQQRASR
jgi:tungstate transport system permease protein